MIFFQVRSKSLDRKGRRYGVLFTLKLDCRIEILLKVELSIINLKLKPVLKGHIFSFPVI